MTNMDIYKEWEFEFKAKVYEILNNNFTEDDLIDLIQIARDKPAQLSRKSLPKLRYDAMKYCEICEKQLKNGTVWYHLNRSKEHKDNIKRRQLSGQTGAPSENEGGKFTA